MEILLKQEATKNIQKWDATNIKKETTRIQQGSPNSDECGTNDKKKKNVKYNGKKRKHFMGSRSSHGG